MTLGPRADYACKKCGKNEQLDGAKVIEDLPVGCVRCPMCGSKRGFERLFNAVNVIGGSARVASQVIDAAMTPMFDKHSATKVGAARFEKAAEAAIDRSVHEATPAERAKSQPYKGSTVIPAATAMGHIPQNVRQDCREVIYPALTNKRVQPQWHVASRKT